MQAVHSPKASASHSRERESFSSLSSVFYPNCLDPRGTSLFPLQPLSSLASSRWTNVFFTHFSLSLQFPSPPPILLSLRLLPSRIRNPTQRSPAPASHYYTLWPFCLHTSSPVILLLLPCPLSLYLHTSVPFSNPVCPSGPVAHPAFSGRLSGMR